MTATSFTIRVLSTNPHREGTQNWRAGLIVTGMEGCDIESIIAALTAYERVRKVGVKDPARWLTHFAGLESEASGKRIQPWIEIVHNGTALLSLAEFRNVRVKAGGVGVR